MQVGWRSLVPVDCAVHAAQCRAFYAARGARRGPASLEEVRQARAGQVRAPLPATATVARIDVAGRRTVPLRICTPTSTTVRGVYLDIPGGGFYLGAAAAGDTRNAELAEALGVAVVSVDYRLAPENPWPAAPDDCEAAAHWLIDQAAARFGTTALVIGGNVSPVFGDLRGLPPTLLIVGALDVLLEDNMVMAARLSAAGNEVDLRVHPESPHGFTGHPTGMAGAALDGRRSWLAERFAAADATGRDDVRVASPHLMPGPLRPGPLRPGPAGAPGPGS